MVSATIRAVLHWQGIFLSNQFILQMCYKHAFSLGSVVHDNLMISNLISQRFSANFYWPLDTYKMTGRL